MVKRQNADQLQLELVLQPKVEVCRRAALEHGPLPLLATARPARVEASEQRLDIERAAAASSCLLTINNNPDERHQQSPPIEPNHKSLNKALHR